ncbi:ankyrin repeat-containing domain protein [Lasiosphaeria ovina]|uniref:Ankyrin repeat-containing domain protein n=1 Tax=Lasiosphaeria ovina TaxID=92902 RepID=A0AAE0JUW5_9PEZI|nr:ankyrin repeat-containing domain protein [Lasiosphaeria ovina]
MADPLSIVASTIAVIQASDRLIALLAKAQTLKEAPAEIERKSLPMLTSILYLPHWLAARAIAITLINGPSFSVTLTAKQIVSMNSEFFTCIRTGDCERIQQLLASGEASLAATVKVPSGAKDRLLFALNYKQYQVCRLLISWDANPHAASDTRRLPDSPADLAWEHTQAWADNDTDKNLIQAIFPAPLDLDRRRFSKLHLSVLGIHHVAIDVLLLSNPALFNAQDRHGRAAAHWAAWKGDVSTLTKLLNHGASPNLADARGLTPLHYACMAGLAACTAALVAAGADLNSADHFGITPLHAACERGRLANVEELLSRRRSVPLNTRNAWHLTPLMAAVLARALPVVQALVAHGADMHVALPQDGQTAALLAVRGDAPEVVRGLVKAGARLDVVLCDGRTVLHLAVKHGGVGLMEALLGLPLGTCRADALTAGGLTPLETLRQRGGVTKELIEVFGALLVKAGWGASGVVLSDLLGTEDDESESEAGSEGDVFVLADEGVDV